MDSDLHRLSRLLRGTIALLREAGESHWADWMETSLRQIEAGDARGVAHLLGAFGGMGSFNDLILDDSRLAGANERLERLRERLYELADGIRRSLPPDG